MDKIQEHHFFSQVHNKVVFIGEEKRIRLIEETLRSDDEVLDFQRILPAALDGEKDERLMRDTWGALSNVGYSVISERNSGNIKYKFSTEWSPPYLVFLELKKRFENELRSWFYDCLGRDIAGYLNGETPEKERAAVDELQADYERWTQRKREVN